MATKGESPDFAVREIEAARPRLRRDLRWTFQEVRGEGTYLLEDPVQGKFYRLGRREHEFVKELDGRRTVSALVAGAAKRIRVSRSRRPRLRRSCASSWMPVSSRWRERITPTESGTR